MKPKLPPPCWSTLVTLSDVLRRRRVQPSRRRRNERGFSLLEIALLLLVLTAMLVPTLGLVNGRRDSGGLLAGGSSATGQQRRSNHLLVTANALMEAAQAGGALTTSFSNSDFFDLGIFPAGGTLTLPRAQTTDYCTPIYYDWVLKDLTFRQDETRILPQGYRMAEAVLRIYDRANSTTPRIELPTRLLRNQVFTPPSTNAEQVSVVFVMDLSASMFCVEKYNPVCNPNDYDNLSLDEELRDPYALVASPYLKYRYTGTRANDIWDDSKLDIVVGASADDPATPYDERYPQPGILGMANCSTVSNFDIGSQNEITLREFFTPGAFNIIESNHRATYSADASGLGSNKMPLFQPLVNLNSPGVNVLKISNYRSSLVSNLCQNRLTSNWENTWINNINYSDPSIRPGTPLNTINAANVLKHSASNLELQRTVFLALLLDFENNESFSKNSKLAVVSFNDTERIHASLQSSSLVNGRKLFSDARKALLWVNRGHPDDIGKSPTLTNYVTGNTASQFARGIDAAISQLALEPGIKKRIIIFVSDGNYTAADWNDRYGQQSAWCIAFTAKAIGDGTKVLHHPNGDTYHFDGVPATIHTVGLSNNTNDDYLKALSLSTPGGTHRQFNAMADIHDLANEILTQAGTPTTPTSNPLVYYNITLP